MTIKHIAAKIITPGNNITELNIHHVLSTEEINLLTKALASDNCRIQEIYFSSLRHRSDNINVIFNILSSIKNLDILEELDLSNLSIRPEQISMLAPVLEKMVSLRSLDLRRNQIGDEGIKSLAPALEKMVSLRSLDLGWNQIGDEGIKDLVPSLGKMVSLRSLGLSFNQIGDEGIKNLAPALGEMTSLKILNLNNTEIGDEGIKNLAPSLEKMTNLQSLNLRGNEIGDEGIKSLAPVLEELTQLEELDLGCNNFDAEGANALVLSLKKLPKLMILNVVYDREKDPRFEAIYRLPEELHNLIFLNGGETKNYEVAKKLAEGINSSGEIKSFEEFLKYSAAVKYFLRQVFKREDLVSSVDYLLKLEDFRNKQAEEIKKLVASEEYKLQPKELVEAKIDEIIKGEFKLYEEFVSSLSEEISLSFVECEMGLLMQQKELPQVNLISIDDSEGFCDEENIQKSKAKIFGLGNQGLNHIQIINVFRN